ncbi:hypothetical protein [Xanthobacter autotrophicus]|uniref:hypothetical protein n=1 Tax=Xanthobacter autotrophicus TaxID=280 RepID=UPI0037284082
MADRETISTILLTVASAGTMMLTYFGVSMGLAEQGAGLIDKGQALAFAAVVGVLSWLGFYFLFGLIPLLSGGRLAGAIAAVTLYVAAVAAIDAPFNMLALAGGSGVQLSLVEVSASYEARGRALFARVALVRRLLPSLKTEAARFGELRDTEIKTGARSGKAGPGRVSAGFGQVASLLGNVVKEVEAGLGEAEKIQGEVTAELARLKAATFRHGALRERVAEVSVSADRLDAALGRLSQHDYAVAIKATLASLENSFPAPKGVAGGFEKIQNEEIAALSAMVQPVAQALRGALGELGSAPAAAGEPVRPADPMTAVKTYWRPLLPQWVAAVFVDVAPALLFLILLAGRREAARTPSSGDTP